MIPIVAVVGALMVFAAAQAVYWRLAARRADSVELLRSRLRIGDDEAFVRARAGGDALAVLLAQSGLPWTKGGFTRRLAIVATVAGILGGIRAGLEGAIALGALGAAGIYYYLVFTRDRRIRLVTDQMPRALELMTLTLRAGHALPRAVAVVADEMPAPVGLELRRVAEETSLGRPIEEAFAAMNRRLPGVAPLRALVTGIAVLGRTGGNLIEVLDRVVDYSTQQAQFRQRLRALTAENRASGFILGSLPPAFAVIAGVVGKSYIGVLFTDPLGRTLGLAALGFWGAGILWIRHMARLGD